MYGATTSLCVCKAESIVRNIKIYYAATSNSNAEWNLSFSAIIAVTEAETNTNWTVI